MSRGVFLWLVFQPYCWLYERSAEGIGFPRSVSGFLTPVVSAANVSEKRWLSGYRIRL